MTWENGRELATATSGNTSLAFTYDGDGIRTSKTVNGVEHKYYYSGGQLLRETYGSNILDFAYNADGSLYSFRVNGTYYYYVTNLQGDVIGIVDANGNTVASYEYDPYGDVISATGTLAATNPMRYRGYYYDTETGFYYVSSRYYDPEICRFINADAFASTGQGLLGNNMFAYCGNNPVNCADPTGNCACTAGISIKGNFVNSSKCTCCGPALGSAVDVTWILFFDSLFNTKDEYIPDIRPAAINWEGGNKNHILNGTDGLHRRGWRRFGIDPEKPDSWNKLLPIIMKIVEENEPFKTLPAKGRGGGWVYFFTQTFEDIGVNVVVSIWVSATGMVQKLSDAIPYIIGGE